MLRNVRMEHLDASSCCARVCADIVHAAKETHGMKRRGVTNEMKYFRILLLFALMLPASFASGQSSDRESTSNFVLRGKPTIFFPFSNSRTTNKITVVLNQPINGDV